MLPAQMIQKTLDDLYEIAHHTFYVLSVDGGVVASTFEPEGLTQKTYSEFLNSDADSQVVQDYRLCKICDMSVVEYVLVTPQESDEDFLFARLAVSQLQNLTTAYKEREDKTAFIQSLLLDNLLLVDIYNRAKRLHIAVDTRRVVFMIETKHEQDDNAMETVKSIYASQPKDYVTAVDERNIIVVKELEEKDGDDEIEQHARMLADMLNTEAMSQVRISYGTVVSQLQFLSRSYKEAQMAMDVGKIFYSDRIVVPYRHLGIGRLIYQLPLPLCRMFMDEIFQEVTPESFDEETTTTINKFFENSLNVSETARQLFIHRNTLVYRLEKLQRSTGLDIRVFDDALTFKIALMVVSYMKYLGEDRE